MTDHTQWQHPLATRYAGPEMLALWSDQRRISAWRRLWLALAEAQHELGLTSDDGATPRITPSQLLEMKAHLDDIDFVQAAAYEKRFRHDVMAHIHTYGDACPAARDIIHLGATSCFVTDNADLMLMNEGLELLKKQLACVIRQLAQFARDWKDLPALGYTHFQPAQLTTVGKRACLWLYDLVLDLNEIEHRQQTLQLRGVKGATGTQASFLALFQGDHEKVKQLERLVASKLGWQRSYAVTGQTYTRKVDTQIVNTLADIAQSAHKFGTDLRLLQHHHEVEEPFEEEQIGSSAMAYKRNPMRAERLCGLARFVINLPANAADTAAVQWLERTLDDSVNRRLTLPQAFLAADAMLRLMRNVTAGLVVNPEMIAANVARELPFMVTEELLMQAVRHGGDRQKVHEMIRQASQSAMERVKAGGRNDLLDRLKSDAAFAQLDLATLTDARQFVGRAPQQVQEFLAEVVGPLLERFGELETEAVQIHV